MRIISLWYWSSFASADEDATYLLQSHVVARKSMSQGIPGKFYPPRVKFDTCPTKKGFECQDGTVGQKMFRADEYKHVHDEVGKHNIWLEECCNLCHQTPDCGGYTIYLNGNEGTCNLKPQGACDSYQTRPDARVIAAGPITRHKPAPKQFCPAVKGIEYGGGVGLVYADIPMNTSDVYEECCHACYADPNCGGYNLFENGDVPKRCLLLPKGVDDINSPQNPKDARVIAAGPIAGRGSPTPAPPSAYYDMITSTYDLSTDKGQKECLARKGHDEAGVSTMGCSYGVRLKACLPWDKGGYKGNHAPKAEWLMQVCCRAQCCAQPGGNCWDTSLITSSTTTTTIYTDLDTNSDSQVQCLYDHGYGNGNWDCNTGAGYQNCGGKSGTYPQSAEYIRMGLNGSSRGPANSAMCNNGNLCKSKEKWSPQKEYVQDAVCFCCASSCAKLGGLCDDWKATSTTTTTTTTTAAPPPSPPTSSGGIEDGVCHGTEDISEGTSVADSPCFDADSGFGPGFSCDTTKMWCGHDSGDGLVVGQCCPKKCRAECEQKKKKGDAEGRNKAEKERKKKRREDESARKSAEKERKRKRKQDEWQNKRDAQEASNKKAEDENKEKNNWAEKKRKNERKWKKGLRDRKEKANKRERTRKSERDNKESKNKNGQANNQAERDRKEKRKKKTSNFGSKEKGKKEKRQKKKKNKGRKKKGNKGRKKR